MSKQETPMIRTERLMLRRFTIDDADDVLDDPEWGRYLADSATRCRLAALEDRTPVTLT